LRQTYFVIPFDGMLFMEDVPLAPYTTFGIGGPARWFVEAASEADILEAVAVAWERHLPLFVLGGGSNLLVSDEGFPGLVMHIGLRGIEEQERGNECIFSVAAGEDWDNFVSYAVDNDCGGIECLAGIPGTVGGTPVQNVGAYGQEVAGTIRTVRALDLRTLQFRDYRAEECDFGYRRSRFNSTERNQHIVTRVVYALRKGVPAAVSYADLKRYFQDQVFPPGVHEVAQAVREIRRAKGMLLVDGDPDCRSAGSFFKNPIVSRECYERLVAACRELVPHYALAPNVLKIPAAWLLEQAGFRRGFTLSRAGLSSKHTLAIINCGGAGAGEVAALRDVILYEVEKKFGIRLEPEPVWVGAERPLPAKS
jgi:UDP-N-acetylmuramate dehydrogenase